MHDRDGRGFLSMGLVFLVIGIAVLATIEDSRLGSTCYDERLFESQRQFRQWPHEMSRWARRTMRWHSNNMQRIARRSNDGLTSHAWMLSSVQIPS